MIRVVDITRYFEVGSRSICAVNRVSFEVQAGEVYGLLGPNGAGKTTTLRMILGLLAPSNGYAEVGGNRADENPQAVKRSLGLLSAGTGVYQWLTTRELLEFFGDLYGCDPDTTARRIEELSELFGIRELLDRRCGTFSTGQKQRVSLARALVHDPPAMLLDEPTRGLDIVGSQVIFDYVAHLRDRGKAVIVCTHRLDEAQRLCDRFGLLNHGSLVLQGTLEELRQQTGCQSLTEIFLSLLAKLPSPGELSTHERRSIERSDLEDSAP